MRLSRRAAPGECRYFWHLGKPAGHRDGSPDSRPSGSWQKRVPSSPPLENMDLAGVAHRRQPLLQLRSFPPRRRQYPRGLNAELCCHAIVCSCLCPSRINYPVAPRTDSTAPPGVTVRRAWSLGRECGVPSCCAAVRLDGLGEKCRWRTLRFCQYVVPFLASCVGNLRYPSSRPSDFPSPVWLR